MSELMRKRLTGLIILIAIVVLIPVVLSQYKHSGNEGEGSMRVYNIEPSGESVQVGTGASSDQAQTDTNDSSGEPGKTAESGQEGGQKEAASSEKQSEFATPSVQGNTHQSGGADNPASNTGEAVSNSQKNVAAKRNALSSASNSASAKAKKSAASASTEKQQANAGADESQVHGWIVQVGSFSKSESAQSLAKTLSNDFHSSYNRVSVNGKTYYHVYVGPFDGKNDAHVAAEKLKQEKHGALVRHLP